MYRLRFLWGPSAAQIWADLRGCQSAGLVLRSGYPRCVLCFVSAEMQAPRPEEIVPFFALQRLVWFEMGRVGSLVVWTRSGRQADGLFLVC